MPFLVDFGNKFNLVVSGVGGFRFCPLLWEIPLFHGSIIFTFLLCEHEGKSFEGFICHCHHFPLVETGLGS